MKYHQLVAYGMCFKCQQRGHCVGPLCHRCRAAAAEELFAALLRGLPAATQSSILWYCHEHPLTTFRARAANLGPLSLAVRSGGPGFVQRFIKQGSGRGPGPSYRLVQICRSALRYKRGTSKPVGAKLRTKAYFNEHCYDVATLTSYGDLLLAISAFL